MDNAICVSCGSEYPAARAALGYNYCMKNTCVAKMKSAPRVVAVDYENGAGLDIQSTRAYHVG